MVAGILLIVMGCVWGIMAASAEDGVANAVIVGPYAAIVAGIGLIVLTRRIAKSKRELAEREAEREKELELEKARRLVRQEVERGVELHSKSPSAE